MLFHPNALCTVLSTRDAGLSILFLSAVIDYVRVNTVACFDSLLCNLVGRQSFNNECGSIRDRWKQSCKLHLCPSSLLSYGNDCSAKHKHVQWRQPALPIDSFMRLSCSTSKFFWQNRSWHQTKRSVIYAVVSGSDRRDRHHTTVIPWWWWWW